jgi:hypothetical protein
MITAALESLVTEDEIQTVDILIGRDKICFNHVGKQIKYTCWSIYPVFDLGKFFSNTSFRESTSQIRSRVQFRAIQIIKESKSQGKSYSFNPQSNRTHWGKIS